MKITQAMAKLIVETGKCLSEKFTLVEQSKFMLLDKDTEKEYSNIIFKTCNAICLARNEGTALPTC